LVTFPSSFWLGRAVTSSLFPEWASGCPSTALARTECFSADLTGRSVSFLPPLSPPPISSQRQPPFPPSSTHGASSHGSPAPVFPPFPPAGGRRVLLSLSSLIYLDASLQPFFLLSPPMTHFRANATLSSFFFTGAVGSHSPVSLFSFVSVFRRP